MTVLFLAILLLLPALLCKEDAVSTYCDPSTGEILTCKKCEPGTYMAAHCTDTKCLPCRANHYTALWNYLTNKTAENKTGTSKQDTVCEKCAHGFSSRSTSALDVCVKHQECADGQLPLFTGPVYHDALCGSCEDLASDSETSGL